MSENILFWFDASDLGSILSDDNTNRMSQWNDKNGSLLSLGTGGGSSYNISRVDTQPNINTRTLNGLNVIDFDVSQDHFLRSNFQWGSHDKFTMTIVFQYDTILNNQYLFSFTPTMNRGDFLHKGSGLWSFNGLTGSTNLPLGDPTGTAMILTIEYDYSGDNTTYYVNGTQMFSGHNTNASSNFNSNNRLIFFNFLQVKNGNSTSLGFSTKSSDGYIAEVICSTTINTDHRIRTEGYLAGKWGLQDNLGGNHLYRFNAPSVGEILINDWTKQTGGWDTSLLTGSNQLQAVNAGGVSIRQSISVSHGDIYDISTTRVDNIESLITKIKTSSVVKWLSHLDDINTEADNFHNQTARFEVMDDTDITDFWVGLDTVSDQPIIDSVSMKKVIIASGTVEVLTNNTIQKVSGTDNWNAGASSIEYINGQGEGYIQFQMGTSGKAARVALVYEDTGYDIGDDAYAMLFIGSRVFTGTSINVPYVSGDWFRIRHDSANNKILYQKRNSHNLEYETFSEDLKTTDGSDLILKVSFVEVNARINDVSMVN